MDFQLARVENFNDLDIRLENLKNVEERAKLVI